MLVNCPDCEAKYNIKEELIPEQGAQLKCTKCGKVIIVYKDDNKDKEEVKESTVENISNSDNNNNEDIPAPFSDFEERPTVLAPSDLGISEKWWEDKDGEKKGIKPETKEDDSAGIFQNFNNEISKIEDDESEVVEKNSDNKQNIKSTKTPDFPETGPSFDDFFGDFSQELTGDKEEDFASKKDEKGTPEDKKDENKETTPPQKERNKNSTPPMFKSDTNVKDDGDTVEVSTSEINKLLQKQLKDGLIEEDFEKSEIDNFDNISKLEPKKDEKKIFVKVKDGPTYEFGIENDILKWLETRKNMDGVSYSVDSKNFTPILSHPIFKSIIDSQQKDEQKDSEVRSKSDIVEKPEELKKEGKGWGLVAGILFIIIILLSIYTLHLAEVVNLSFLDSITPERKVITKNISPKDAVKVKLKKVNKAGTDENKAGTDENKAGTDENKAGTDENKAGTDENKAGTDENKAGTDENKAGTDENKAGTDENKAGTDENKAGTDENKAGTDENKTGTDENKAGTDENKEFTPYKITRKEKRGYYKKARIALKEGKYKEAREYFLTIAYNYPENPEAYGALNVVLRKLKDYKNAKLFAKAYKGLSGEEKKNSTVTKKMILEMLKK